MAYGTRSTTRSETAPVSSEASANRARQRRETLALEGVTFPLIVGAIHFVIVQITASLAFLNGTPRADSSPQWFEPDRMDGWAHQLVEPLRHWDGLWYKLIAEEGYGARPNSYPAFWPLFPWLMNAGRQISGVATETAGWFISNITFFLALIVVYRLVALDFDRAIARRTLWVLALFPTAFFFSAVYTESLFLLLAAWALLCARTGNWAGAGCVGLLAALTRSQGVLLLLPFAVLFFQQKGPDLRRWVPDALYALLPTLGPVIFAWHLDRQGVDPLAFIKVQEQWGRYQAAPWQTLKTGFTGDRCFENPYINCGAEWGWLGDLVRHPTWSTLTSADFRYAVAESDTLELVATLLFLGLALIGLRRLPLYYSALVWPALLIPLYGPSLRHALMSMPRFGLVLFPLFVMMAILLSRPRWLTPVLIVSTILLILFTAQFAQWYWVS
ncbi:MAG TPA: mannosyltransferase family protein [Thermomicrobiales bacterium]|nr:mannosyltransferase family protein [Thermomicrobiales bacterium]